MSKSRYFNIIAWCIAALAVVITLLFMFGEKLGIKVAEHTAGYETRLFDTDRVHTIDIVMNDWDSFIETCENEEYSEAAVVIDGESYKNIAIRAKGNTSLSSVKSMNSSRYSFKIEFDHYDSSKSYYGLDKLSLNNLIQDSTMMKDYLVYQMMNEMGVDSPLCSFVYITVNGEDWGLYLAVEGVEDAFLERCYNGEGELYKPDSTDMGGGRGNGKEFDMDGFMNEAFSDEVQDKDAMPKNFKNSDASEFSQMFQDFDPSQNTENGKGIISINKGGNGTMSSDDVKLNYIDDNPESYPNIFDNAKTNITEKDKERLISSLKNLSECTNIENTVDIEKVIKYFAVHNWVVNGDSYTGSIVHNYYLYENNGILSMIPWDYNLAFGTFQSQSASDAVNSPIDTPVLQGMSDRPMISWIFENEEYLNMYHDALREFSETVDPQAIINKAENLIKSYVEKDPSKFCTYEEFEKGVEQLRLFCTLRNQSVMGQLDGTIPSTQEEQSANPSSLVDASSLTLSDMGTMGMNGGDIPSIPSDFSQGDGNMPSMPSDFSQGDGNMPSMPSDFSQGDGDMPSMPSDFSQGDGDMPSRKNNDFFEGERKDNLSKGDFQPQNNEKNKTYITLLAVSFAVLIVGIAIAKIYRRRK